MKQPEEDFFGLGSIHWAKVGTHPWWPCIIHNSPNGEGFVKVFKTCEKYHVQFLGPVVERAWVSSFNLIPYQTHQNLEKQLKDLQVAWPALKAKYENKVPTNRKTWWDKSWREADKAFLLNAEERLKKFGRIQVFPEKPVLSIEEEAELSSLMDNVPLTLQEETESMETFLQVEKTKRLKNNVELDEHELDKELRLQWPGFDIQTKRSYLSNKLALLHIESNFGSAPSTEQQQQQQRMETRHAGRHSSQTSVVSTEDATTPKPATKVRTSLDKPKKTKASEDRELDLEIHRLIASPAPYRFQPVCPVCEVFSSAPGQMLKCKGVCGQIMHPHCMRYKEPPPADNQRPEVFKCPQCLTRNYLCAVCGKPSSISGKSRLNVETTAGSLLSCQVKGCGRHFHRDCLHQHPGCLVTEKAGGAVLLTRCPAHVCATCCLEDSESTAVQPEGRPMLQCVRCPRVFHTGDLCTPAGSVEVSLSHIVCPVHFVKNLNKLPQHKVQSVSWCFRCRKPGPDRIFCETCPTNYHKACMDPSDAVSPAPTFTCDNCRRGVQPRYAQVIWAKIPCFRWWPCEVIHARNAPLNILNMAHPEGTFLIHFIGSGEYQWVSRGQTFAYEVGLGSSATALTKGHSKNDLAFNKSVKMAPKVHEFYVNYVWKRGLPLTTMHANRLSDEELLPVSTPEAAAALGLTSQRDIDAIQSAEAFSSFQQIAANRFTPPKLEKLATVEVPTSPCKCSLATNPRCSVASRCSNVLNNCECTPQICSILTRKPSTDCGNRPFSTQPSLTVFRTANRGFGLKLLERVKKNAFVVEFIGEVIGVLEANKRLSAGIVAYTSQHSRSNASTVTNSTPAASSENAPMTFLLRLTPELVIDAQRVGNMARFVNHSCEPNLEAKCYNVNGRLRMGLFALSALEEKEELTLDYRRSFFLDAGLTGSKSICLCGADTCVGSLRLPTAFPVPETALRSPAASPTHKSTDAAAAAAAAVSTSPVENQEVTSEMRGQRQQRRNKKNMSQLLSAAATSTTDGVGRPATLAAVPPSQRACKVKQDSVVESFVSKVTAAESRGPRRPLHDDFCYRCGDGGELVLCDKSNCPKSYHLNCLGLVRPPNGTWYCPWHFCDDCGHPATHLCWRCPNSYCLQHADKRIAVDELDAERWQAATKVMSSRSGEVQPSSLEATQILPVVLSCRWICIDHANVKISGPGHRPSLLLGASDDVTQEQVAEMKSVDPLEDVENKAPTGSSAAAVELKESEEAKGKKRRVSLATGHPTPRRLKHPPGRTAARSLPKKLITAKYVKAGQLQHHQKRRPRFLSMVERKRRHSAGSNAVTPQLKRKRSS
uniref:Histone-lysine N-methyltransferase, H3 lysine-36 and H4 lysine-20 specific n=1 Tax=Schistocephalus solidus TaxID=70667 RepID=A0A0X3P3I7_SCHSO